MSSHANRRGVPSSRYQYNDPLFGEVTLQADDKGVIEITSDAQARVADRLHLPPAGTKPKKAATKPAKED